MGGRLSWIAWALVLPGVAAAAGETPQKAAAFLEELRGRGYFDTAAQYVEELRRGDCPAVLRATLDYEDGLTRLAEALTTPAAADARPALLDRAMDCFRHFRRMQPEHRLAQPARVRQNIVRLELGRGAIARAAASGDAAGQQLVRQARQHFVDAQADLDACRTEARRTVRQLTNTWNPPNIPDHAERREDARRVGLQAGLLAARAAHELADAFGPQSSERMGQLLAAQQRYHEVYAENATLAGGLSARLWEARVLDALGQSAKAAEILDEFLALPGNDPAFRLLKGQALLALLEGRSAAAAAARRSPSALQEWHRALEGAADAGSEAPRLHFLLGAALLDGAAGLKPEDPQRQECLDAARRHLDAAAAGGPWRYDAQLALADPVLSAAGSPAAATYADAVGLADAAWRRMSECQGTVAPDAPAEATPAGRKLARWRGEALRYYRAALAMAPAASTSGAQSKQSGQRLAAVRFRVAWLSLASGETAAAAAAGRALAEELPDAPEALPAALVAAKAYRALLKSAAAPSQAEPHRAALASLVEQMARRWPGRVEVDQSWVLLADDALENYRLDAAIACLERIAGDSPHRTKAELCAAQAAWGAYLRAIGPTPPRRPADAELDALQTQAAAWLAGGLERTRMAIAAGVRDPAALPDEDLRARSALLAAQLALLAGQPQDALRRLDDAALRDAIADDRPGQERQALEIAVLQTALTASLQCRRFDDADRWMAALEALFSAPRDAAAAIAVADGVALQGRLVEDLVRRLRPRHADDIRTLTCQSLGHYADGVIKRHGDRGPSALLHWAAAMLESTTAGGGAADPAAYRKAADAYEKLLARAQRDRAFLPTSALADQLRLRLAVCRREGGQADQAVASLKTLLARNPRRLDVQVELARTLQRSGPSRAGGLRLALEGSSEPHSPAVWGWEGLAARLQGQAGYIHLFHEACYNRALCRLELAAEEPPRRAALLGRAAEELLQLRREIPDAGGPQWRARYDALLKEIQRRQGQAAAGFAAAGQAAASPVPTTPSDRKRNVP